MRKIKFIYLIISIFLLINTSCFLTYFAYIKTYNGKINYNDYSKIFVNVNKSSLISASLLQRTLQDKMMKYKRVPRFNITDSAKDADCSVDITITDLKYSIKDIDKTLETKKAEEDAYNAALRDYERKLEDANLFKTALPEKPNEPDEITTSYIVSDVQVTYNLTAKITDNLGFMDTKDFKYSVIREIVKEHKKAPWNNPNLIEAKNPLEFIFNLNTKIIDAFITASIDSLSYSDIGGVIDAAYKKELNSALKGLREDVYSSMAERVIEELHINISIYKMGNLYLLKINKDVDDYIKNHINAYMKRNELINYLLDKYSSLTPDEKAKCYFNIALLYKYERDNKNFSKYNKLAEKDNPSEQEMQDFSNILSLIE